MFKGDWTTFSNVIIDHSIIDEMKIDFEVQGVEWLMGLEVHQDGCQRC